MENNREKIRQNKYLKRVVVQLVNQVEVLSCLLWSVNHQWRLIARQLISTKVWRKKSCQTRRRRRRTEEEMMINRRRRRRRSGKSGTSSLPDGQQHKYLQSSEEEEVEECWSCTYCLNKTAELNRTEQKKWTEVLVVKRTAAAGKHKQTHTHLLVVVVQHKQKKMWVKVVLGNSSFQREEN